MLADAGFDVTTITDVANLAEDAPDRELLDRAVASERVLVSSDMDFASPHRDDHVGIILIASDSRGREAVRRGVERVLTAYPDLSGHVEFVSGWLE